MRFVRKANRAMDSNMQQNFYQQKSPYRTLTGAKATEARRITSRQTFRRIEPCAENSQIDAYQMAQQQQHGENETSDLQIFVNRASKQTTK